jgi:hypothetical protein
MPERQVPRQQQLMTKMMQMMMQMMKVIKVMTMMTVLRHTTRCMKIQMMMMRILMKKSPPTDLNVNSNQGNFKFS